MNKGKEEYDRAVGYLCHCRLEEAKYCFVSAAKIFAKEARSQKKNIDINKLNAAICFYLAGSYADTLAILDTIRMSRMDQQRINLCDDLRNEANKRRKSSYFEGISADYQEMKKKGMHKDILRLLKDDPYLFILQDKHFAKQWRDSCLALGMTEISAAFDRDYQSLP